MYKRQQFLNSVKSFNKYNQESWELKLVRIVKYFKGDAKIWADAHNDNWAILMSLKKNLKINTGRKKNKRDYVVP